MREMGRNCRERFSNQSEDDTAWKKRMKKTIKEAFEKNKAELKAGV